MECFLCGEKTTDDNDLCNACMERGEEEALACGVSSHEVSEFLTEDF